MTPPPQGRRRAVHPAQGHAAGEIGTLIDEVANPVDVTATIIDLAVRGFLRIEEITNDKGTKVKDWRLVVVLPAPQEELLPYELELMQALFKGRGEVELRASCATPSPRTSRRPRTSSTARSPGAAGSAATRSRYAASTRASASR